jgi:hypothetical protein
MVEKVPRSEQFSFRWLAQGANRAADLIRNFAVKPSGASIASLAEGNADGLLDLARQCASAASGSTELDRPESLADYASLFPTIELRTSPQASGRSRSCRHRSGGANPLILRRITGSTTAFSFGVDVSLRSPERPAGGGGQGGSVSISPTTGS